MADESLIRQIKGNIDIVSFISEYTTLKKAGVNYTTLCPFHREKTGSLIVSPEKQYWHCFGCGEGGDIFKFLMKKENISFPEAILRLGAKAGIDISLLRNDWKKELEKRKKDDELCSVLEKSAYFFQEQLKKYDRAVGYLADRQINRETVEKFNIGYAPNDNSLVNFLKSHDKKILKETSLVLSNENGSYSYFRGRIIFPIHNDSGKTVGFAGRALDDNSIKYINSRESSLYSKRKLLYGIDKAKNAIREKGEAIIVEGYMDALAAHQAGIENCVATGGTALTSEHAEIIKRLGSRAILCFDRDEAGIRASLKGGKELLKADLETRIMALPEGDDPDDFIKREGSEKFLEIVEKAKPLFEFNLSLMKDAIKKRKYADDSLKILEEMIPFIKCSRGTGRKQVYVSALAKKTRVSEECIYNIMASETSIEEIRERGDEMERRILKVMLKYPEYCNYISGKLDEKHFKEPESRAGFSYLKNACHTFHDFTPNGDEHPLFSELFRQKMVEEISGSEKIRGNEIAREKLESLVAEITSANGKITPEEVDSAIEGIKKDYKKRKIAEIGENMTASKNPEEVSRLLDDYYQIAEMKKDG